MTVSEPVLEFLQGENRPLKFFFSPKSIAVNRSQKLL